jgi:hypothetical protein
VIVNLPVPNSPAERAGGNCPGSANPVFTWLPSQKGWSDEWPQRHSIAVFIVRIRVGVTTTRSPVIMFGPSRCKVPTFNSMLMAEVAVGDLTIITLCIAGVIHPGRAAVGSALPRKGSGRESSGARKEH